MSAITIRKLPDDAKQRLRMRAATNGRSMEAEARSILLDALNRSTRDDTPWFEQLIEAGNQAGGIDIAFPPDEPATFAEFPER